MKYFFLTIFLTTALLGTGALSRKAETKKVSLVDPGVRSSCNQCVPNVIFSHTVAIGGPSGYTFDDASGLRYDETLKVIHLRSASRIDKISFETKFNTFEHGGNGGYPSSFILGASEKITSVHICYGHHISQRVFYVKFTTNHGRHFSGGQTTRTCETLGIPSDKEIVAGFGRSGSEIDKLGFVLRVPLCN